MKDKNIKLTIKEDPVAVAVRTDVKTREFHPNTETIEALEEAERLANGEGKVYHSFDEILKDVFGDDFEL
jgi:hypothetical protein